jgi:hypothetical protein
VLYLVLGLVLAAFGLLIAALTTANTLFAWLSVTVSVVAAGLLVYDWLSGRRRARDAEEDAADDLMVPADRPFGDEARPLTDTHRGDQGRDHAREEPPAREPDRNPSDWTEPPRVPPAERVEPARAEQAAALLADHQADQTDQADGHADDEHPAPPEHEPAEITDVHLAPDVPEGEPERADVPYERLGENRPPPIVEEQGEPDEEETDASDLLVVAGLSYEVRVVDEHPRYHLAMCSFLMDKPTIPLPVSEARQLGFTPCLRCGPDATLAARHRAAR